MSSFFYPTWSLIQSIEQGVQTTVTFTEACTFTPGQIISFRVYPQQGMVELNNQELVVQSVSETNVPLDTVTVNVDSRNYTPFIFTSENVGRGPAMCVPSSSGIVPGSIPIQTNLVDAFDNVPTT